MRRDLPERPSKKKTSRGRSGVETAGPHSLLFTDRDRGLKGVGTTVDLDLRRDPSQVNEPFLDRAQDAGATRSRHVLAMVYVLRDSVVLCLHNFDEKPRDVTIDVKVLSGGELLSGGEQLRCLFGSGDSYDSGGRHWLRLDPLGYDWYRVR
jgi:hypothetical protein